MQCLILLMLIGAYTASLCPEMITMSPYFWVDTKSAVISMAGNITYEFGGHKSDQPIRCDYTNTTLFQTIELTFANHVVNIETGNFQNLNKKTRTIRLSLSSLNHILIRRVYNPKVKVEFINDDFLDRGVYTNVYTGIDRGTNTNGNTTCKWDYTVYTNYIIHEETDYSSSTWTKQYINLTLANGYTVLFLNMHTNQEKSGSEVCGPKSSDGLPVIVIVSIILIGIIVACLVTTIVVYSPVRRT